MFHKAVTLRKYPRYNYIGVIYPNKFAVVNNSFLQKMFGLSGLKIICMWTNTHTHTHTHTCACLCKSVQVKLLILGTIHFFSPNNFDNMT